MSQHFHTLTIADVTPDTPDAVRLKLRVPPEKRRAFRFRPGQHLAVRTMHEGSEIRRTYSICSGPDDHDLSITVKRVEGGWFSQYVRSLKAGDELDVMEPSGRFVLPAEDGDPKTYLAIAAGSGITPVMAMIRHAMARQPASRFVLIYGNRTSGSILFRQALDDLKDTYLGRLVVVHVLSHGEDQDIPLLAGRINGAKLKELLPRLVPVADIDHAFLCGPGTLIKEAMTALQEQGLARDKIHFEFFKRGSEPVSQRPIAPVSPAPVQEVKIEGGGADVVMMIDGVRYTIRTKPGEAIIDAALRSGVNAPYSCKGGMCCTCRAKLIEGDAPMTQNFSLEPWEMERGFILTCQAVPRSSRVVVDYDQV